MNVDKIELLRRMIPNLLAWYEQVGRILPWRENTDPYRIWVSEIMLQQTRIEAVKPYYERFMSAFPDIPTLSLAPEEKVLKMWEGLGYYSRAKNLQKTARICMEQHEGKLPASYEELKSLPGIGNYTAGAIGSIAFGLPVPAVDGNVLRVLSRVFADNRDFSKLGIKKEMEQLLRQVIPETCPGAFNEAIMEIGETICIPNGTPLCEKCPLEAICLANHKGESDRYPVKIPKKTRRVEEKTVLLLEWEDKFAIRQRPAHGLLADLYEFPCLVGFFNEEKLQEWLESGIFHGDGGTYWIERLGNAKHVFSHVEWHMVGYRIKCAIKPEGDWQFLEKTQILAEYPIPTAYRAYTRYL